MLNTKIKEQHLNTLKEYRKSLMTNPQLRYLFLELTMKCNERCIHCGSRCGDVTSEELTLEQY